MLATATAHAQSVYRLMCLACQPAGPFVGKSGTPPSDHIKTGEDRIMVLKDDIWNLSCTRLAWRWPDF